MNTFGAPLPWGPALTAMAGAATPTKIAPPATALRFHFILEVRLPNGDVQRLLPTQLIDQQQKQPYVQPSAMLNFAYPGSSNMRNPYPTIFSSSRHHQHVPTTLETALRQLHDSQLPNLLWKVNQVEFLGVVKERQRYDINAPMYSIPLTGIPLSQIILEDDYFVVTPSSDNPFHSMARIPITKPATRETRNNLPTPIISSKVGMDIRDIVRITRSVVSFVPTLTCSERWRYSLLRRWCVPHPDLYSFYFSFLLNIQHTYSPCF